MQGWKSLPPLHARDGQKIYLKYNFENQTKNQVQESPRDSLGLITMTENSAPLDKEK